MSELLHGDDTCPEAIRRMDEALNAYHSAHITVVHYDSLGEPQLDQFRVCPVYDELGRPSGHFVGFSAALPSPRRALLPCSEFAEPSRWLQPDLLDTLDDELNGDAPRTCDTHSPRLLDSPFLSARRTGKGKAVGARPRAPTRSVE